MVGILWGRVDKSIALSPLYPNTQEPHVTLQYGVARSQWEPVIGLPMTVAVIDMVYNDRIQAIALILPTWAPCQNPHPHITLSWVDGAAPVEANAMLLSGKFYRQPIEQEFINTMVEWLEWGALPIKSREWSDRPSSNCPTCLRQGKKTETRSLTGYCRKHRPNPKTRSLR